MKDLPSRSKVVVIGGGVVGCSVAYHLAKFGWKDTILLERDQLTSGTTWHAAGLIGQLGSSATITKLRNYSLNLYKQLEKETGLSTGLKQNGSLTVATTKGRLQELKRQVTTAQLFNVEANEVSKDEIKSFFGAYNLNVFIDKAYANDWDVVVELNKSNVKIDRMQENLNIIDKNVRVLEKIIDTAENNLTAAINNACK